MPLDAPRTTNLYNMVQDQRTISWTQMAILEMPQNGSLSTFSCNSYHEEFIFFTFHAKSGHRKIFKKIPILSTLPYIDFTIEAGKKFMSKKKPQEIGLLSSKKLSIGSFILLLGTFLCFHFFDFGPIQGVAFFFDIFLNFFRISDRKPIFPNTEGSTYQERSVFVSL